jgi:hypothetical protein
MTEKVKLQKQYKAMGFGDRDDKGSVEAHLRAEAEAREMRQYNTRMKELEAEDARRRGGIQGYALLIIQAWDTMMNAAGLMNLWKNDLLAELSMGSPTDWPLWNNWSIGNRWPVGRVGAVWTSPTG